MNIIAGHETNIYSGVYVDEVELSEVPGHIQVGVPTAEDEATYAEPELTDAELLALATEDAVEAHATGELAGPALDEVSLRRATRRARRRGTHSALRTVIGGAA